MPKLAEIRKIERKDDRCARWGISIPQQGRRAKRVFFVTKARRDREFDKLRRVERQEGLGALSATAADMALLADLRALLPVGVDPRVAVRFFVEHHALNSTVSMLEAWRGFTKRQQVRQIEPKTLDKERRALDRLVAGVGSGRMVAAVTSGMVVDLLGGMVFAPVTIESHRKVWSAFFGWCVREQFCRVSPMLSIDRVKVVRGEVEFMPARDVALFFEKALEIQPEIVPALALSFFAGLRSSSIERLVRGDLDFEERGIRLQAQQHKTGRRFFVQGFPDNLWVWLEPWRGLKELPRGSSSVFIRQRNRVYTAAGVDFPHNAGRHSFCTHHIALFGSADQAATLLTHRGNVSMLYDHYRGNAKKADAEIYFDIVPEAGLCAGEQAGKPAPRKP